MEISVAKYEALTKDLQSIWDKTKSANAKRKEAAIRELFGTVSTDRRNHTHQLLDNQGQVDLIGDGEEYPETSMGEGFQKTFTMIKIGEAVVVTEEIIEDDLYNKIYSQVKNITNVIYSSMYNYMAGFLNNAWSTSFTATFFKKKPTIDSSAPDGQPLISASHSVKSVNGYTASNAMTTPTGGNNPELNFENLEYNYFKGLEFLDSDGGLAPKDFIKLVVWPSQAGLAERLIYSDKVIGGNDNDINTMKNRLKILVIPQLQGKKWFLSTEDVTESLKLFMRVNPTMIAPLSPKGDDKTGNLRWRFRARFQAGLGDPLYIFGSKGDNS